MILPNGIVDSEDEFYFDFPLQVAIHAIGDRAVDDVTEILRSAIQTNVKRSTGRRHRIEHVQHLSSTAAAATLAESGILAVVNPLHLLDDRDVMIQRLGLERSGVGRAFAYNTLQKVRSEGPLTAHEDCVSLSVLYGVKNRIIMKNLNEGFLRC